jgi:peptide-methionine (S)-S-oxide reductase
MTAQGERDVTRTSLAAAVAALALAPAAFGGGGGGAHAQELKTATFAGGCFWCVEADFDHVPGVVETVSGYTGGTVKDPSYEQVSAGGTGHREAVRIAYDPSRVSYEELLTAFWHSVDPTDAGGQFCDRGESYQTAIFFHDEGQRRAAEASKAAAQEALGGETIVTPIEAAGPFYPAEDYHQGYYEKNPLRYRYYRWGCGRDARIEQVWGERAFEGIPGHG